MLFKHVTYVFNESTEIALNIIVAFHVFDGHIFSIAFVVSGNFANIDVTLYQCQCL